MEHRTSPRRQSHRLSNNSRIVGGIGARTPMSSTKKNRLLNYLASRSSSSSSSLHSQHTHQQQQQHQQPQQQQQPYCLSCSLSSTACSCNSSSIAVCSDPPSTSPNKLTSMKISKDTRKQNVDKIVALQKVQEENVTSSSFPEHLPLEFHRNDDKSVRQANTRTRTPTHLSCCFPRIGNSRWEQTTTAATAMVVDPNAEEDEYSLAAQSIQYHWQTWERSPSTLKRRGIRRLLDVAQGEYGLTLFLPIQYWEAYDGSLSNSSDKHNHVPSPATTISTWTDTSVESNLNSNSHEESLDHHTTPMTVMAEEKNTLQSHGKDASNQNTEMRHDNNEEYNDDDDDDEDQQEIILASEEDDIDTFPPILSRVQMQTLHSKGLPPTVSLMTWNRAYSLQRDGDCFSTMFHKVSHYNHTLIVIKTVQGDILGGYADTPWGWANHHHPSIHHHHRTTSSGMGIRRGSFFGSGRAFLFATNPNPNPNSNANSTKKDMLSIYKWTGENEYSQICDVEGGSIGMGGGGAFGFYVQDNFTRGSSGRCQTFANPSLVQDNSGNFEISDFEVYGFISMSERLFSGSSLSRSSSFASMNSFTSPSRLSSRSFSSIL